MSVKTAAAMAISVLACGCASTATPAKNADAKLPVTLSSQDAGIQGLRPINDSTIPSNECGMVLWTLEASRPAAVFRFITGKQASHT